MSYDLVEIAGRVQRLERDNRRLKLGAGALVAVLVALPLVAAVLPPQNPFRQQQEVPQRIVAREFQVLDEDGAVRARLGVGASLSTGWLTFFDEQGEARVALVEDRMIFADEQGKVRAALRAADGLRFNDEQGTLRAGFSEDGLRFNDEQGAVRVGLEASRLAFADEQGVIRVRLSADGLGLGFSDEQGELRATLSADNGLVFFDEQGKARISLSADIDGLAYLDEQGAVRLKLGRVTVVNPSTKAETTYPAALVLFDEEGNVIESLPR